ncbi:alpha,alpha-trehalose-phosphate synthase [UDP-forming] 1-like [Olea europaea subsp. europaea]|uniref:Trehalose 6-phosphate phosphatase n=1 Tax=Olea europaea subsp. europaea TaxID=158383 RepID=A0A8S0QU67_OLEEU|nr:alpha,alpha-trehalose-phosphate synthase [UDP-forming] 1-like [Olea europaea subsp. europaea]
MELKLHPDLIEPLKKICDDPKTTTIVLSGSDRSVLDENFGEYKMWLAAEHGMFLRFTKEDWMTTMPESLNMDWVDSVKHVFEYFTERTPRSHFELRETSLVWNYKYADVEFGRLQAKDMLQHLLTGPISNASVDVVQGGRSVEVRAVGVTKGAAIDRILGEIVHHNHVKAPIDHVLCIGHFLPKDEDIYTFFEPELPSGPTPIPIAKMVNSVNGTVTNLSTGTNGLVSFHHKPPISYRNPEKIASNHTNGNWLSRIRNRMTMHEGSSVLDLKGDNYFSCAVGRKRSNARYLLGSSADVVSLLKELADCQP